MTKRGRSGDVTGAHSGPAVPVGGGVPVDPETGERFGYLPRKAAQRKIIIRRTLGLPWVLGALAAAALIAVTGIAFFASRPDQPGAGYDDVGALSSYPAGAVTALADRTGWVDRRAGLLVWLTTASFCPADGGWAEGTQRWDQEGRPVRRPGRPAAAGLSRARVRAANNRLYVDRRSPIPAAPATDPTPSAGGAPAAGAILAPCPSPRPLS